MRTSYCCSACGCNQNTNEVDPKTLPIRSSCFYCGGITFKYIKYHESNAPSIVMTIKPNCVSASDIKKARKHGELNDGIPFGQVPGDEQYTDSRNLKPGDKDYLGPLP